MLTSTEWLDGDRRVLRAAGGYDFMLLLDDKAHVYAVGSNSWGRLGRGHRADERDNRIPRPVAGIGNASAVKCKLKVEQS